MRGLGTLHDVVEEFPVWSVTVMDAALDGAAAREADFAFRRRVHTPCGTEDVGDLDADVGYTQQNLALAEAVILQALRTAPHRTELAGVPTVEQLAIGQALDPGLRAEVLRLVSEVAQPNAGLLEADAVRARVRRILIAHDRAALQAQQRAEELVAAAGLYESIVATRAAADAAACTALAATRPSLRPDAVQTPTVPATATLVADTVAAICEYTLRRLADMLPPLPSSPPSLVSSGRSWTYGASDEYALLLLPVDSVALSGAAARDTETLAATGVPGEEAVCGLHVQLASVPVAAAAARPLNVRLRTAAESAQQDPTPTAAAVLAAIQECDDLEGAPRSSAAAALPGLPPNCTPLRELAIMTLTHGLDYAHTHRRAGELVAVVPATADDSLPPVRENGDVLWSWGWPRTDEDGGCRAEVTGLAVSAAAEPLASPARAGGCLPPAAEAGGRAFSAFGRIPGLRVTSISPTSRAGLAGLLRCHDVILGMGGDAGSSVWGLNPYDSAREPHLRSHVLAVGARVPAFDDAGAENVLHHPWAVGGLVRALTAASAAGCILVARPRLLLSVEAAVRGLTSVEALQTPWPTRPPVSADGDRGLAFAGTSDVASGRMPDSESCGNSNPAAAFMQHLDTCVLGGQMGSASQAHLGVPVVRGSAYCMGCEDGAFRDTIDDSGSVRGYLPSGAAHADPGVADLLQHYPSAAQQAAALRGATAPAASSAATTAELGDAKPLVSSGARAGGRPPSAAKPAVATGIGANVGRRDAPLDSSAGRPLIGLPRDMKKKKKQSGPVSVAGAVAGGPPKLFALRAPNDAIPASDRLQFSLQADAAASQGRMPVSRADILIAALRLETRHQRIIQGSAANALVVQQRLLASVLGPGIPASVAVDMPPISSRPEMTDADAADGNAEKPAAHSSSSADLTAVGQAAIGRRDEASEVTSALVADASQTAGDDCQVPAAIAAASHSETSESTPLEAAAVLSLARANNPSSVAVQSEPESSLSLPLLSPEAAVPTLSPPATVVNSESGSRPAPTVSCGFRVSFRMLTASALRRVCAAVGISPLGDKFALATRLRQLMRASDDSFCKPISDVALTSDSALPLESSNVTEESELSSLVSSAPLVPLISNSDLAAQAPRVQPLTSVQSSSSIFIAMLPEERETLEAAIIAAFYPHPEIVSVVRKTAAGVGRPLAPSFQSESPLAAAVSHALPALTSAPASSLTTLDAASATEGGEASAVGGTLRLARQRKPSARLISATTDDAVAVGDGTAAAPVVSMKSVGGKRVAGTTPKRETSAKKSRVHAAGGALLTSASLSGGASADSLPLSAEQQVALLQTTMDQEPATAVHVPAVDTSVGEPTTSDLIEPVAIAMEQAAPSGEAYVALLTSRDELMPPEILGSAAAGSTNDAHLASDFAGVDVSDPSCSQIAKAVDAAVSEHGDAACRADAFCSPEPVSCNAESAGAGSPCPLGSSAAAVTCVASSQSIAAAGVAAPSSSASSPHGSALPLIASAPNAVAASKTRNTGGRPKSALKHHRVVSATSTLQAPGVTDMEDFPALGFIHSVGSGPRLTVKTVAFASVSGESAASHMLSRRDKSAEPGPERTFISGPVMWRFAAYRPSLGNGIRRTAVAADPFSAASAPVVALPTAPTATPDVSAVTAGTSPGSSTVLQKRRRSSTGPLVSLASGAPSPHDVMVVGSELDFTLLAPALPPVLAPSPACELIARIFASVFAVRGPGSTAAQRWLVSARVPDARPAVARAVADIASCHGGGGDAIHVNLLHREVMPVPGAGGLQNGGAVSALPPAPSTVCLRTSALDSVLTVTRRALEVLCKDLRCFPLQSPEHSLQQVRTAHALLGDLRGALRDALTGHSARSICGDFWEASIANRASAVVTAAGVCRIAPSQTSIASSTAVPIEAGGSSDAVVAEYVVGAATADPLMADIDPILAAGVGRSEVDLRTLVQRITARDLGRAASSSEAIARFLASSKPFFVCYNDDDMPDVGNSSLRGECVGAIAALRISMGAAADTGSAFAAPVRLLVTPTPRTLLTGTNAIARVIAAALDLPLLQCRVPVPIDNIFEV